MCLLKRYVNLCLYVAALSWYRSNLAGPIVYSQDKTPKLRASTKTLFQRRLTPTNSWTRGVKST